MPENLQIAFVKINQLKPAEYNPRKSTEQQNLKLEESIKRYGLVDPIIVNGSKDRKNIIIGGHFRWRTAKRLKLKEVPVVYVNLDLEKEKELNLRLNRNTGEWDFQLLKDLDLDLLLDVGFDDLELSHIWDDAVGLEEDGFNVKKELEKDEEPKTKIGDIYQLGPHRLICGDSTNPEVVKKLMDGAKTSMLYCDPPYNINYDYQKGLGDKKKYGCKKVEDSRTKSEYADFLQKTIANGLSVTEEHAHVFYWCDQNYIGLLQSLFEENKLNNKRVCLWIKNNQNVTPNVAFNKAYEPCVYAVKGKPWLNTKATNFTEILNTEVDNGNRTIDDLLDLLDIWMVKRITTNEYQHPTQKPVPLHERPLKRCTKPGDIVVDLFGGSGSTLAACDQLGRKAYLVEQDPKFCDVVIARYLALNPTNHAKKCN